MTNVFVGLAEWLLANIWTILIISAMIYSIASVRFLIYWGFFHHPNNLKDLPPPIAILPDVKLAIGFALALACGSIDYALLVLYPNLGTFVIVLLLNLLIVGSALSSILLPVRRYNLILSDLKSQHK